MSDAVLLEVDDGIATITLNRPEVRNAIDLPTALAIAEALDEVDERGDVAVAILTGAGTTFCAGMDLKAFAATKERPIHERRGAFGIVRRPCDKPLIAAIEGNALGGGLEIALACDLVVATESSRLGLPEVKRGLVAAAGGVLRLPRRIPQAVALELIMTGEPLTAGQAKEWGLVNRVAPDGEALVVARELAAAINANAPLAVRAAKRIVVESADWTLDEGFDRQAAHTDPVRSSADAAEGARAFVEKRTPVWSGA
ncbi:MULTISPECIES: crotonase/enoyl-CoA hydratase family protein [unclassified Nocardioides]|uniref:crotonase/enoyl-CoA hydratase family protein n=1 Tax=unclassified Nocardioides TaxID=2615069 RepID=UPI000702807E|nr:MULTISPECIES: crotonase/enoyl-CoA hydratase family protein [unclassified Nocardioides]KRC59748.1 enoyl-CoA hydratase [Nocardioides sp. Root79]KRC68425.1 enoyl-CoA hydratase [Nocardioides sp. Root240]